MNDKELKKLDTIKKVAESKMTIKEAMNILMISRQQIYRLIKKYKENKVLFIKIVEKNVILELKKILLKNLRVYI